MTEWISLKKRLPPCDADGRIPFVLAFHTVHGVGVAWFWVFKDDGLREELEEDFKDKYICSAQFIFNKKDGNYCIKTEDDIDIFEHSPHFKNLGTISHWAKLPETPK